MTSREWLRAIAGGLEDTAADHEAAKGVPSTITRQSAAALRALADRLDEYLAGRGGPVLAAMRKLDAPLPSGRVMPGKETT